jgi:UDP-N-acetylglucosamine--N-acetylmuramyl-(pentapeptide) pyrophosphoryl-undecaprenol N-acetylglucosamine transferase
MRIAFAGGGTLGSVTPLLAVAKAVRERRPDAECLWIGTTYGPESRLVAEAGLEFHAISSGKFRRYLAWQNVTDLFRIIKGLFGALALFRRRRPDVLVSAGGFVAVPAVWAAWLKRIPVHLHQMDIRPGLANKLSAPFAVSMSVALDRSVKDFSSKMPVWTGNPVRPGILAGSRGEARKSFSLEDGIPTVLVMGGGTGAVTLNDLTRQAAPLLAPSAQIIHLTGQGKTVPLKEALGRYHQLEFLTEDMKHAYAAADLVVTRAGMGALTELAALGLPAIVIPIADSHQEENAAYFADRGAASLLSEKSLTAERFAEAILGLLRDAPRSERLRSAMKQMNRTDASSAMAELILAAAERTGRGKGRQP